MNSSAEQAAAEEPNPLDFDSAANAVDPQTAAAFTQARWHVAGLLGVIILFAAADSWVLLTDLGVASAFAMLAALIAGIGIAQLTHEWGHYLGAKYSGAIAPFKSEPALLAYDYDYKNNTPKQFLAMSYGGTLGNFAAILLVWLAIPMDAPHREWLLASTIGTAVFVAVVEWPVIKHAREHNDPMAALIYSFGGGLSVFVRAVGIAVVAALLVYWVM